MKKKIISVVLTLGMMLATVGCGSKNPAGITIEGKTYDLSGDFQEVVGAMAEDDLQVAYGPYGGGLDTYVYDEDGKLSPAEDFDRDEPYLFAYERQVPFVLEEDDSDCFIQRVYMLDKSVEFESKLGITSESEKKEIKDLDGFMKATHIKYRNSDTYVALFVDGKMVDFDDYEENFEEWKDTLDDEGFAKAYEECFSNAYCIRLVCRLFNADFVKLSNSYDELEDSVKQQGISLKEEIILAFAMSDACELLEDEEAESIVVVKAEITEDDEVIMEYNEFYFDDDWDADKFKN